MPDLPSYLHGATLALLILLLAQVAMARIDTALRIAAAGYLLGGITHHFLGTDPASANPALLLFCLMNPAFLWWMVLCIFDEHPRHGAVGAMMTGFLAIALLLPPGLAPAAGQLATIAVLGHVVYRSLTGLSEDLVGARRAFRLTIGLVLPLIGIADALALALQPVPTETLLIAKLATDLAVALGFAIWITALRPGLFDTHQPRNRVDFRDEADARALADLLATGIHRQEGLTIGALANELSLPEHRVRQIINTRMGYRNFSALLNDLRIDDAKAQLADPDKRHLQIAQIAFAAGYASLPPFNRAFRDRTGQSPSEFRRDRWDAETPGQTHRTGLRPA
ncbi:helix-turn-helix transcriptional regulator [Thalassococcus sp. CAU 1522]|uniref:Helix-turn-helix transcriptional regulator n=1 Tax=Thalassococcus arenae TaxID=2851652 RepID=A0ABS6N9S5_9RHOB|nr:helix-turn-helix transcriptional regulator [Thalassococcus arenae]MBV2360766.1 helix-turn-helix transcriptional regulator [Thalassococcus arenae]